jgi:uncharacterized membrane protein
VNRQNASPRARPAAPTTPPKAKAPAEDTNAVPTGDLGESRLWRPIATGAICILGIAISIYLLIVHYDRGALICHAGGVVNCEEVLTSPSSVIFGIPVPILGLAYFIGMGAISLPAAWRAEAAWLAWGRVAGAVAGVGMVVYLIYQEALVLHAICLWCTGIHVLTFAMFLIIITGWEDTGYAQSRWND